MERGRRWLLGALLALLSLFIGLSTGFGSAPASADTPDPNNFTIESFHAEYTLTLSDDRRSMLSAVETITPRFPDVDQNRGLQRAIPHRYLGESLRLSVSSVSDETGAPRPYDLSRDGDLTVITSAVPEGEFVHGRQTYVFAYTMENVTRSFEDTGTLEWYWDVNGDDWWQPIDEVRAHIILDAELSAAFTGDVACYVGPFGSTTPCPVREVHERGDGTDRLVELTVQATGLQEREGLTFAIGFTPGSIESPTAASATPVPDPSSLLTKRTPLLWGAIVAGLGAVISALWGLIRRVRFPRSGDPIIARYSPPPGIPAALAAELWNRRQTSVPATILDLAVRGHLRLLRDPTGRFGMELVRADGLDDLERAFVRNIFADASGQWTTEPVWITRDSSRLGTAGSTLIQRARERSERAGLRAAGRSRATWLPFVFLGAAVVALLVHGWLVRGMSRLTMHPPEAFFGIVIVFFVVLIVNRVGQGFRPLTTPGAQVRDHLAGLKEYIELAEADRIRMLQSASGAEVTEDAIVRVYERLLPYAVIFGQEREWQAELGRYYRDVSPEWFSGDTDGAFLLPIDELTRSIALAQPATSTSGSWSSTSTSSSSSGGSFGGGFSGGGGGGGGGRGI